MEKRKYHFAETYIPTAASSVPDADDTAKAIMALRCLGKSDTDVKPLVKTFESDSHFLTYIGERNSSFSTNCNVLMCLSTVENARQHASQIIKTANFLSAQVLAGEFIDKWVSVTINMFVQS